MASEHESAEMCGKNKIENYLKNGLKDCEKLG